jgi:hypothetical protein
MSLIRASLDTTGGGSDAIAVAVNVKGTINRETMPTAAALFVIFVIQHVCTLLLTI